MTAHENVSRILKQSQTVVWTVLYCTNVQALWIVPYWLYSSAIYFSVLYWQYSTNVQMPWVQCTLLCTVLLCIVLYHCTDALCTMYITLCCTALYCIVPLHCTGALCPLLMDLCGDSFPFYILVAILFGFSLSAWPAVTSSMLVIRNLSIYLFFYQSIVLKNICIYLFLLVLKGPIFLSIYLSIYLPKVGCLAWIS